MCLGQLLDIAIRERFDLGDMRLGRLEQTYTTWDRTPVRVRRDYRYQDHRRIEQELERALRSGASISEVVEILGADQTTLARHEELYQAVVEQSRKIREAQAQHRWEKAVGAAAEVVRKAAAASRVPSLRFARQMTGEEWRLSQLRAIALMLLRVELGDPEVWKPSRASSCSSNFLEEVRRAAIRLAMELREEPLLLAA